MTAPEPSGSTKPPARQDSFEPWADENGSGSNNVERGTSELIYSLILLLLMPKTLSLPTVINIKSCPLCQKPRLSKKGELGAFLFLTSYCNTILTSSSGFYRYRHSPRYLLFNRSRQCESFPSQRFRHRFSSSTQVLLESRIKDHKGFLPTWSCSFDLSYPLYESETDELFVSRLLRIPPTL